MKWLILLVPGIEVRYSTSTRTSTSTVPYQCPRMQSLQAHNTLRLLQKTIIKTYCTISRQQTFSQQQQHIKREKKEKYGRQTTGMPLLFYQTPLAESPRCPKLTVLVHPDLTIISPKRLIKILYRRSHLASPNNMQKTAEPKIDYLRLSIPAQGTNETHWSGLTSF